MILRVLTVDSGWGPSAVDTDPVEVSGDPRAAAEAEMRRLHDEEGVVAATIEVDGVTYDCTAVQTVVVTAEVRHA